MVGFSTHPKRFDAHPYTVVNLRIRKNPCGSASASGRVRNLHMSDE